MAIQTLSTIKSWFKTTLKPTQFQFWDTWDSFWHKLDKIPIQSVENLENIVNDKASTGELNNHIGNPLAHADLFDKKADAEALKEHMEGGQAHYELFKQKVDKEEGMGLSQEDFTTELKEKLEGLGGKVKTPTLDAVLTAGNSSKKSIALESGFGNPQSVKIDATGLRVGSNFLETNFDIGYKGNEILFKHTSRYSDRSTKHLRLKVKEGGTDNNPSYTQHFQDKSGTIALLEDIPSGNSEPMPKKAVFTIAFEIDPDGTKTFHHEQLYNNVGELLLKGEFITDPESENNMRLLLSLQFPEVYAKAVCMQENINLTYTMITLDSRYFSSLSFMVETTDKGVLELITAPFMFMWFEGESKKLTFNAEFLLVE